MVWAGYQKDKPYDQRVGDLSQPDLQGEKEAGD
jgi:hypothetical protein